MLPSISSSFWSNSESDFVNFVHNGSSLVPSTGAPWKSADWSANGLQVLASEFVGALAHELGHIQDVGAANELKSLDGNIGINQGFYTGILLLSEGKATANAVSVAEEVANNSKNTPGLASYVPLVNLLRPEGIMLLTNYSNPNATSSVDGVRGRIQQAW